MAGSFHAADGTPLVNTTRFPSLRGMCDFAHARNLSCGFYMNNCGCAEHQLTDDAMVGRVYQRSAA
eukprot:gene5647-20170_t